MVFNTRKNSRQQIKKRDLKMITETDLLNEGFVKGEDGSFQKEENDRVINCFRNPKGGGYWVVTIDPIKKNASNDRIATIEELKHFIELTCCSEVDSAIIRFKKL